MKDSDKENNIILDPKVQEFINKNIDYANIIHENYYDTSCENIITPENISLNIIRPKFIKEKLPVLIYLHGGGWSKGDKEIYNKFICEVSYKTQSALVFINYSLSPEAKYPKAIKESYSAIKWIKNNSNELNLNTEKLIVIGDSAGGNMAISLGLLSRKYKDFNIDFQVLLYPVTDNNFETNSYNTFKEGYYVTKEGLKKVWNDYLPDLNLRNEINASPLKATIDELKNLPKTLIITAEVDVLRDEGEYFAKKLIQANVDVTVCRFLCTIHLFATILPDTNASKNAMALIVYNINEILKIRN